MHNKNLSENYNHFLSSCILVSNLSGTAMRHERYRKQLDESNNKSEHY